MTYSSCSWPARTLRLTFPFPVALLAAMLMWGCSSQEPGTALHGYAEGEYVLVAAPLAGRLEELSVQRGARVEAGDLLFVLEHAEEKAAVQAAEQEVQRAASRHEDLRKGQRPSELRALEARVEQARSTLNLSQQEFNRRRKLVASEAIAVEEFDRARTALERDRAALADLEAQLRTAQLGSRSDAIAAAQAELDAVRARLDQARWALTQKSQYTTQAGLVFDTLYEPGEFVRAGYPVVSLLPPGNIKIRFFVPEPLVGRLRLGQPVKVAFDGSDGLLPATISFISPQAEYTPPVIYSNETRAKLVFLVEARPDPPVATRFHPGQPVDVLLESGRD
jgi:HlyD family secretion protein